ncbi:DeoR/GlpR family DNA-binding transcription regulator [Paenibacillus sp. HB172176]|uniref:DeoR/GlpR family DNA-binding transcription regulator n=1 Tax=Paenibacillus sp. HB172176 TaxID=2493690 RepID=UPI001439BFF7|nr:DeoR/GlpR family DNA-binding transcription regulator [Paenibacillus sp. HB172176]
MSTGLNDRQKQIISMLQKGGEIKIGELKDLFSVTDMTLRRDFEKLEQLGMLRRTYGGAILNSREAALPERATVNRIGKERIGETAAKLILPGESVFIDSGSTTLQIARALPIQHPVTVVTNAIHVAAELSEKKIPTVVIGGVLLDTTDAMAGTAAVESISKMAFDKVFLGTTGLSIPHGFSNSNMLEADVKRIAIGRATETYIVMDQTKFNQSALFSFASLAEVHAIITDEQPGEEWLAALLANETGVIMP